MYEPKQIIWIINLKKQKCYVGITVNRDFERLQTYCQANK